MFQIHNAAVADLSVAIEKHERPDRMLDAEIAKALGAEVTRHQRMGYAYRHASWQTHPSSHWCSLPRFTGDPTDAVRLVEELPPHASFIVGLGRRRDGEPIYGAQFYAGPLGSGQILGEGRHPTSFAAALVSAALDTAANPQRRPHLTSNARRGLQ